MADTFVVEIAEGRDALNYRIEPDPALTMFEFTPQSDITAHELAQLLTLFNMRCYANGETIAKLASRNLLRHLTATGGA